MKNLEKLLKCTDINYIVGDTNKEITDITADSREVKEGSLFICLDGALLHRRVRQLLLRPERLMCRRAQRLSM